MLPLPSRSQSLNMYICDSQVGTRGANKTPYDASDSLQNKELFGTRHQSVKDVDKSLHLLIFFSLWNTWTLHYRGSSLTNAAAFLF